MTPEAQQQLGSTPQVQSTQLPAHVVVVKVDEYSTPAVDFYAGRATNPCTSGFTIRADNGKEGFAPAGHCTKPMYFNGDLMPLQEYGIFSGSYDLEWHTSPSPYDDRAWFLDRDGIGSAVRGVLYVRGRDHQAEGETSCKSGKTTGYTCGEIVNRSFRPCYTNHCNFNATFIRVDRFGNGNMVGRGDSGGPVFYGNTARGIVSASKRNTPNEWTDLVYMPINYVANSPLSIDRVQTTN